MRRIVLPLAGAAALLLGACTTSPAPTASPSTSAPAGSTVPSTSAPDPRGGIQPGYPTDVDQFTPLIITAMSPDPMPVTATDGKVHAPYEIQILNSSPRPATITKLETLENGPDGKVVATLSHEQLVPLTLLVGDYPAAATPVEALPPGRAGLLLLDGVYANRADVPKAVTHRVTATFGDVPPGQGEFATRFPTAVTQVGGTVTTSTQPPVVIGSPLAGNDWLVANGCCEFSAHRAGMLPLGGRINPSERYAIDWVQVDATAPSLVDESTGLIASYKGDSTVNENYIAYNEPLLAVADGTVVTVTGGQPDQPPQTLPTGLPIDKLGGNVITIDIGNGIFAFYAHTIPGSAKVKVGDRVTKGQVVALLGNSGNSSEAHLHFQLMRAPAALASDNVGFEIEQLTFVGTGSPTGIDPGPNPGPRTNQYPLADAITNFPAQP